MKATLGTDKTLLFWCPGCNEAHGIPVDGTKGWTWNGSLENPTVSPSIVIGRTTWVNGFEERLVKCHSFVREGTIEFLSDSVHELAGQTVDLPDWDRQ